MADNPRWTNRPAGSTWGDYGADDERGRPKSPDAGKGPAGHRRGEGRQDVLPVAAARLSRRRHPQPAPPSAGAEAHHARRPAQHELSAALRRSDRHRHRLRRHGAPDAAILDAVGQPRPCRADVRRRWRRPRGGRVLQRLSRRPRHHRPRLLRRAGQHDAVRRTAGCAASRRAEHGGVLHAGPRRDDRPGGAFRPHRPHRQLRRTRWR